MKPTKWRKFSYLRDECLQTIYYDKMINHNNVIWPETKLLKMYQLYIEHI